MSNLRNDIEKKTNLLYNELGDGMSKLRTTKHARAVLEKKIVLFTTVVTLIATPIVIHKNKKEVKEIPDGYSVLYTSYEVKSGETLWSIASDNLDTSGYNNITSYIEEIKQINHIEEDDKIKSGQHVIISYLEENEKEHTK